LKQWNENPGYHQGANLPLKEAATYGWFHSYDWVVRINPDVLIYNDTWMLDVMKNDHNASAILVDCLDRRTNKHPHTDFFANRSTAFPEDSYRNLADLSIGPELVAKMFFGPIITEGRVRWLPDTGLHKGMCRVGTWKKWGSPVIHSHDFLQKCPQPVVTEEGK
jgi:hypothetical protein